MAQCSIAAFEGLLDEPHNKRLMKLLYRTAEWHGFTKLRLHTSHTLDHLERLTTEFGALMRHFRDHTCSQFQTMELPRETAARKHQDQRAQRRVTYTRITSVPDPISTESKPAPSPAATLRKMKTLNLFTPKFHSLGDYVRTIRQFGCTDSFSTQVV